MFKYKDWVKRISDRFQSEVDSILAEHGFDYGPEFEVALCKVFNAMLPDRYGVCRGYVVDQNSNIAGDDIVIYERARFPTIAVRDAGDFSRKEYIPIEATYAYIEAKHTLTIHGNSQQSLARACEQVSQVKTLVCNRTPVDNRQLDPYLKLPPQMSLTTPEHYPKIQNPLYTMVVSRRVRSAQGQDTLTESDQIITHLSQEQIRTPKRPDLVVLGNHVVILPVVGTGPANVAYASPFLLEDCPDYHVVNANGVGFGIAVLSLLFALDWINLGVIPWKEVIEDALRISPP